jgi:hypothetical protein
MAAQQQPSSTHPRRLSRRQFFAAVLAAATAAATGGCATAKREAGAAFVPLPTTHPAATAAPLPTATPTATPTQPTPTPLPSTFSGEQALQHAVAQMQFVPRHTGTEGWRQCGDYILSQLSAQGWETEEQPFTYMETNCRNLIGKRGSGPLLIIGAHYDSRRRADHDPDPAKRTQPVPAANDGASGVAVLLELARILNPDTLGRTIWLVAFDAEDNGGLDGWDWIIGSRHFVSVLNQTPQGMVLVDMIGDADQQIYYEYNSHAAMSQNIWQTASDLGYTSLIPEYRHSMIDDHIPFVEEGIPAVDLIDFDYPHWHTTHDTMDKISAESLEVVGRTLEEWLLRGAPGMPSLPEPARQHLPLILNTHGCQRRAEIQQISLKAG